MSELHRACLKKLKDPIYDGAAFAERWETHYYAGGRVVIEHWKNGKKMVVRGCATCDCLVAGHSHNLPEHGYSCAHPKIRTDVTEQKSSEFWESGMGTSCRHWQGDIGICEKHGEYLKKEGCFDCAGEEKS